MTDIDYDKKLFITQITVVIFSQ